MSNEIGNRIVVLTRLRTESQLPRPRAGHNRSGCLGHEQRFGDSGFKRDFVKELVRKLHGLAKAADAGGE